MRRSIFCQAFLLMLLAMLPMQGMAQRISRSYTNRSMSEVLKDLGKASQRYKISFIYNELEDFTVTTSFSNLTLPEALGNVFGFYPLKATVEDSLIFVECTQKEPTKLMGRVWDEHHRPIEFANVVLLNPQDSSFITGGVTNACGNFVIPCGMKRVIAKVSCVGYHTLYNIYNVGRIGNLMLRESTMNIHGVVVKAKRPSFKRGAEGMLVDVQHTDYAKLGDALDVFREMPRLNVSNDGTVNVFGKGTPLIYINNKQVRDVDELKRLKSGDIKNVEIITSPGAKYDATVSSVIRVKTVKKKGEGLSGSFISKLFFNGFLNGFEQANLNYQHKGLELFSTLYAPSTGDKEVGSLQQKIEGNHTIMINQYAPTKYRSTSLYGSFGFNYDINDSHSIGASYEVSKSLYGKGNACGESTIVSDGVLEDELQQRIDLENVHGPQQDANFYYMGTIGKMKIDFNASYIYRKTGRFMTQDEAASEGESRMVHTDSRNHNTLWAGKLILSHPLGKGSVELGSELTSTRSRGAYSNEENIVASSSSLVKESNVAGFLSLSYPLGYFSLQGGVRYEYVNSDFYQFDEWQSEPSRKYGNWFPNFAISYSQGKWSTSLSYTCQTQRPSYNSLRNEVQYDNRYMYEGGNPYLRSSLLHNLSWDIVYSWINFGAEYEYTDKPIVWYATLYDEESIAYLRNMNFCHNQALTLYLIASPKLGWYNPTCQVFYQQQFLDGKKYGLATDLKRPSLGVTWNNKFSFSSTFTGWLTLHGNTYLWNDFQRSRPGYYVSMRLVKTFMDGDLNVNLYANDIFKTQKQQWTMFGDHVTLTKDAYDSTREVGIRVTYSFNSARRKYKGTGAGAAEKSRL